MTIRKLSPHGLKSLARALAKPAALRTRAIGARLREQVILHVSAVNECAVCSALHGVEAQRCGLDDDDIAAARQRLDRLDERTRVALRYAELRTQGHLDDHPDDLSAFEDAYDERERSEIAAIVDLLTFNNQFNNTWEAVLPGARQRRRKLGIDVVPDRD